MGGRLPPQLAAARRAVLAAVSAWRDAGFPGASVASQYDDAATDAPAPESSPHVLLAVSGGADSMALAATAAFLVHASHFGASAVLVDHGLQPGSADAVAAAAERVRAMGLSAVVVRASVPEPGTEEQARHARYRELEAAAAEIEAETGRPVAILTGHTLSDQAEQVLLGLARGSGTRSVAGIPAARGRVLRPFLGVSGAGSRAEGLWRGDTEFVCAHESIEVWDDPTNAERDALRNRVRLDVLPALEEQLGPGFAASLARTAGLAAADADHLDALAGVAYAGAVVREGPGVVVLDLAAVRALPAALGRRVLRSAAQAAGGEAPTYERTLALERLVAGAGSAGPVQLAGHVVARRLRDGRGHGHAGPILLVQAARGIIEG
ncbi:tRNA lysidine(34) synthetase TilS [Zhihengliuella halotolerans]|uniref:tRNA lysidine(34) synthetase TilS n=1 Tax=Zhihengliuella halotolerans TaxID=370736 RepID=UPI000C809574|nr:tRNA lysidine(34) synthetase TilS [Zhihengliuella halotolerans]